VLCIQGLNFALMGLLGQFYLPVRLLHPSSGLIRMPCKVWDGSLEFFELVLNSFAEEP